MAEDREKRLSETLENLTKALKEVLSFASPDAADLDLLLPDEAAQFLKVSVKTLNRLQTCGLTCIRIAGVRRYRRSDLRRFINEQSQGGR
jgi:hypothetical protein